MKYHKLLLSLLFLYISSNIFSQKAWVVKEECSKIIFDTTYNGYNIQIYFLRNNDTIKSNAYLESNPFINFSDTEKLMIIQELLNFGNDTSLCCKPALSSWGPKYECNYILNNRINHYTIQIDVLYRINGIAFPNTCWIYSCYPILYDKTAKIVINDKPQLIKEIYCEYKRWFSECQQKGKISNFFPFNDGRYVWIGGKKSFYPKEE